MIFQACDNLMLSCAWQHMSLTMLILIWPISDHAHDWHAGTQMEAMFMDVDGARPDQEIGPLPQLPVPVNYPQQASFTLLPLEGPEYDAEVP